MKRVEMLEAKDSFKNVDCNVHVNTSVSRHKSDGDFEILYTSPKVRVPGHKPAADLEHGTSPMHGDDDDGFAASTVSWVTVRSKDVCGCKCRSLCASTEGSP